jgi:ABC-2 type transport system permease protein
MMQNKYFEVAKFEFLKIVRKKSFWVGTLFMPLLIGVIALISGLTSVDATKRMEQPTSFSKIYLYDVEGVINSNLLIPPFELIGDVESATQQVKNDKTQVLVKLSDNFYQDLSYELYYRKDADFMGTVNLPTVVNALIKQSAFSKVADPNIAMVLNGTPTSSSYTYDANEVMVKEGFEKFVLPIMSLIIFFIAVFISSAFLLQSVSAEKENRMIETILSIVDKKSLMFGKMIGLMGVMFIQLFTWVVFGFAIYKIVMSGFNLPIPIDFNNIDLSVLPLNIFLIIAGFFFFAAIMVGTGAIGTGAGDSRNLSSIFILLAIFPMYLMQALITNPMGPLAVVLSYFPFTSFMVLLIRNSFGALSTLELIIGVVASIIYVVVAMLTALKLFEVGCLMYNRRPSAKEAISYLWKR